MRALSLLGIAVQAGAIRLNRQVGQQARSGLLVAGGALFVFPAVILVHVAAWVWLAGQSDGMQATLLLAAADLGVMAALLLVALSRSTDPVADEARELRQQSLAAIARPATLLNALQTLPWQRPAIRLGAMLLGRLKRSRAGR